MNRGERLLRGVVAACAAVGAGLAFHVAAGGQMPAVPGIVVPLALGIALSVPLAGRSVPRLRLGAAVLGSQALFHVLFTLGSPATLPQHLDAHGHGTPHGGTAGPVTTQSGGAALASLHAHHDVRMIAAHLAAAALAYMVLRRMDAVLEAASALAWWFLSRLMIANPAALPALQRVSAIATSPAVIRRHRSTASRRGPPVLA